MSFSLQKEVGQYLSGLMDAELTHHLGRQKYERPAGRRNHRNGGYRRISLRTTKVIELLNKELKRRTKSMEILAAVKPK
jgi:transposase-like protein